MPKIVDHEKYRIELLEKCFDLLSIKGYSNITMREIADELGISTGSLYHYFQNKQSILDQLFDLASKQNVGEALELIQDKDSLEKRLDVFESFCKDNLDHYKKLFLLAVDFARNSDPTGATDTLRNFIEYYAETIGQHLRVPRMIGSAVVVFVLGLVCQALLAPATLRFDEQMAIIRTMILHGSLMMEENR